MIHDHVYRAVHQHAITHIPVFYGDGYEMIPDEFTYGMEGALAEVDYFVTVDAEGQVVLAMHQVYVLHSNPSKLLAHT